MKTATCDSLGGAPSHQAPTPWSDELVEQYREHFDRFVWTAERIVCDRALAEECVQDAFLAYQRKRPNHDPDRLTGYLRTMVRNTAISKVRREARQRALVAQREVTTVSAEAVAIGRLAAEELVAQVITLPRRQLQVVDCRLDGLSVGETADVLDISSGSVKTHRFRAATAMRRAITDPDLPEAA